MFVKYIPDGYWHSRSNGVFNSHEAICVLNTAEKSVAIELILYFENRDVMTGFHVTVEAKRTLHIRMDRITNTKGEHIPADTPYAVEIRCSHPVQLQYSRVDTSQSEMAVATTIL